MKKILFLAVVATSLFACQQATKPAFDLANAKKEIEAANHEISEALSKGDSVAVASAYSKDGALMVSNSPSIKGQDKLTAFWGGFIRLGIGGITLTTSEVWGDENFITEEGLFEIKSKDGAQLDKGKYIVIWKKEDGKWKLHRDLSNTDLPLATK
jgi:ketosteroid isomerase-like protein